MNDLSLAAVAVASGLAAVTRNGERVGYLGISQTSGVVTGAITIDGLNVRLTGASIDAALGNAPAAYQRRLNEILGLSLSDASQRVLDENCLAVAETQAVVQRLGELVQ